MPRLPFVALGAVVALAFHAGGANAATCAPQGAEPVDVVRRMFADAAAGDRARTVAAFDRDGFLFDGGVRFTPEGIVDFILKGEAAGVKPQWKVEDADSHVACDLAWATWTNHGAFTTPAGVDSRSWLESAVFVWRDGAWKIRFFHSTLAKAAP